MREQIEAALKSTEHYPGEYDRDGAVDAVMALLAEQPSMDFCTTHMAQRQSQRCVFWQDDPNLCKFKRVAVVRLP